MARKTSSSTTRSRKTTPKTAAKKKAAPAAKKKQQSAALRKANSVRSKRARVRRSIESGKKNAADVLRNLPPELQTATVMDFLTWIPGVGETNARKITRGVVLNLSVELQTLGEHSMERLAQRVERRVPGEQADSLRDAA